MSTAGKPSREQLEEHYKKSRQYFDDLAQHYKESDPEYYNSTIAPIIRKYRHSDDGGYDDSRVKRSLMVTSAALLVVVAMSVGIFFLVAPETQDPNPVDELYEKMNDDGTKKTPAPVREVKPRSESEKDPTIQNSDGDEDGNMTDYDKGVFYYDQRAYDRAMEYFGKVRPGDPNYDHAQKYLSEISMMPDDERKGIAPEVDAPKVNPQKK